MRKLTLVLIAVIFSATAAFAQIEIQSGKFTANQSSQGWSLDKNSGDRSFLLVVPFPKPFQTTPKVVLSINMIDADGAFNMRYDVQAIAVSRDNITIKIATWADSKIYGIGGSWIAHTE